VDGLDEDQTLAKLAKLEPGLAIATWLPDAKTLPDNACLLVASRAGVAVNFAADHPIRQNIHHIDSSAAATEIEKIAEDELKQARQSPGLVYDVLGLLTAPMGGPRRGYS
jgi:hypothetical protein